MRIFKYGTAGLLLVGMMTFVEAQQPPQQQGPSCEEQMKLMRNYLDGLRGARDNAEITVAALRQQVQDLEAKLAAKEPKK